MDLKRGIDLAVDAIVVDLKTHSKKVTSNDEIAQVGTHLSQRRPLHWRRDRQCDAEGRQ
jgi:chaperonin GroEL (HSP60 family)